MCDVSIIKTKDQIILNDWWLQLMSFISCNLIALQEICPPWLLGSFCLNLHNSSPGNFGDGWYRCAGNPFFVDNCNVHWISHGAPSVLKLKSSRIHFYYCLLDQNCIANLFFFFNFQSRLLLYINMNKLCFNFENPMYLSHWVYDYPFHCNRNPWKIDVYFGWVRFLTAFFISCQFQLSSKGIRNLPML